MQLFRIATHKSLCKSVPKKTEAAAFQSLHFVYSHTVTALDRGTQELCKVEKKV